MDEKNQHIDLQNDQLDQQDNQQQERNQQKDKLEDLNKAGQKQSELFDPQPTLLLLDNNKSDSLLQDFVSLQNQQIYDFQAESQSINQIQQMNENEKLESNQQNQGVHKLEESTLAEDSSIKQKLSSNQIDAMQPQFQNSTNDQEYLQQTTDLEQSQPKIETMLPSNIPLMELDQVFNQEVLISKQTIPVQLQSSKESIFISKEEIIQQQADSLILMNQQQQLDKKNNPFQLKQNESAYFQEKQNSENLVFSSQQQNFNQIQHMQSQNQDFENKLDKEISDIKNFYGAQNHTGEEIQRQVQFQINQQQFEESQNRNNEDTELKIQLSNISNCEDDRSNENAATVPNYLGQQKGNKIFQNLSSIGSDSRKEVYEFVEDQHKFDKQLGNQEVESLSEEEYDDEEGSNENESVLDKTVIIKQGAYERIIKEEPQSTKRIKKHKNDVSGKRRSSKQDQRLLRAGGAPDETRRIADQQSIIDVGLRLTFGANSMKQKVPVVLSQEISPIDVQQSATQYQDSSQNIQLKNEGTLIQQQSQQVNQDDDTSKTVTLQDSQQFNQKSSIVIESQPKQDSSLTVNIAATSEVVESIENQVQDETASKIIKEISSQEQNLFPTDEDDDEAEDVQQKFVFESPNGRFKRFAEELGRGAYKTVYRGVDHDTGREVAWSLINISNLPKSERPRIKSEISLIKQLDHPNIITFISAWITKETEQIHFITEMITGGSLRQYLKKMGNPKLKVIKKWCHEILQGLNYLHSQKTPIIHRDIKCDNIFVNSNSGDIKIGDLGLSTTMNNSYTCSVLGTPEFMAPELYEEHYGTEVDIYAFGMAVLEMLTQEAPYRECQNPAQIYRKVVNRDFPKSLERINDPQVYNFITWCLAERKNRPSAEQLLQSEFMNDKTSPNNDKPVSLFEVEKVPKKFPQFKKCDLNGSLEGIPEQEEPCSQIMTNKIHSEYQSNLTNQNSFQSQVQESPLNQHTQIINHSIIQDYKEVNEKVEILQQDNQENEVIDNEKIQPKNENVINLQNEKVQDDQTVQQTQKQNKNELSSIIHIDQNNQQNLNINKSNQNENIDENSKQYNIEQSSLQQDQQQNIIITQNLQQIKDQQMFKDISKNDSLCNINQNNNIIFQKQESNITQDLSQQNDQNIGISPRFCSQIQEKADSQESQSLSQSHSNNGLNYTELLMQKKNSNTNLKENSQEIQNDQIKSQAENIEKVLNEKQQQLLKWKSQVINTQVQRQSDESLKSPEIKPEAKLSQNNIFQYGSPQKKQIPKQNIPSLHQQIHNLTQQNLNGNHDEEKGGHLKTIFQQLQEENKNDKQAIIQQQNQGLSHMQGEQRKERQKFKEETFIFINQKQSQQQVLSNSAQNQNENQQSNFETTSQIVIQTINATSQNQKQLMSSQLQSQLEQTNYMIQPQDIISDHSLLSNLEKIKQENIQDQNKHTHHHRDILLTNSKIQKKGEEHQKRVENNIFKKEFKEDFDKNYQPKSCIMDIQKLKSEQRNSSSRQENQIDIEYLQKEQSQQKNLFDVLEKSEDKKQQYLQYQNNENNQQKRQRSRSFSKEATLSSQKQQQEVHKILQKQQTFQTEKLQNTENLVNQRKLVRKESQFIEQIEKSEQGSSSSKNLGDIILQLNQQENKNDQSIILKNEEAKKQMGDQTLKIQQQQKNGINIQLVSSNKQNQRKYQKLERSEIIEFKKKIQTALKPKKDLKQNEFDNQQPIEIGRVKEIDQRENIRKKTGTPNNYASRKDTRSVPPRKQSNNKKQIQEPQTTKISQIKQGHNNTMDINQKKGDRIQNNGNQTTTINEITKIDNFEIITMTINFGDDVVSFDFCLGRDTPERVASDFAGQMNLDLDSQNQFCKEIHENLRKYQLEKKKNVQQRGRNGSGQTAKEKPIDHQNSFFNSQYPQGFTEYQQNLKNLVIDQQKQQNLLSLLKGERTNEKNLIHSNVNEKVVLQNEELSTHKALRQSMLEMNNNNLCETNQKETNKHSNGNESLIRKKQIMKDQVISVIRGGKLLQPKNGQDLMKKIISPENIQFSKEVKQYKVTHSNINNQNQPTILQQKYSQKSPSINNIQKNQGVSINIVQEVQSKPQIEKQQIDSPQTSSVTINQNEAQLQQQKNLQNLFKNMKNSIRDFFDATRSQEIMDVTYIIGQSEQFQNVQLQNEFIQQLNLLNQKYLQPKIIQQPISQIQSSTLNGKVLQVNGIKESVRSPKGPSISLTQKMRPNKDSFHTQSNQQQLGQSQQNINSRALYEQAKAVIRKVKQAVKDGMDIKQNMDIFIKEQNNLIRQNLQDKQSEQGNDNTDNSSIKASAGSSTSSIMTVALQANTQADQMKNLLPLIIDETNEDTNELRTSDIKLLQGKLDLQQDGIITMEFIQKIERYLIKINYKNESTSQILKKTKQYQNSQQKPINQVPNNQQNGALKDQIKIMGFEKQNSHGGSQSLTRQKSLQPTGDKKFK